MDSSLELKLKSLELNRWVCTYCLNTGEPFCSKTNHELQEHVRKHHSDTMVGLTKQFTFNNTQYKVILYKKGDKLTLSIYKLSRNHGNFYRIIRPDWMLICFWCAELMLIHPDDDIVNTITTHDHANRCPCRPYYYCIQQKQILPLYQHIECNRETEDNLDCSLIDHHKDDQSNDQSNDQKKD
jgi:hypothetical protein